LKLSTPNTTEIHIVFIIIIPEHSRINRITVPYSRGFGINGPVGLSETATPI
jgi:hypothetical protein